MVLSPGNRKHLAMMLDLLAHKNPKQPDYLAGTPRLASLQPDIMVIGTRRRSSKNRESAGLNVARDERTLGMYSRTFAWKIKYDYPIGKYRVYKYDDVDTENYLPYGNPELVGTFTKDEVLARLDDRLLVDIRVLNSPIGRRWEADRRVVGLQDVRNTVRDKRAYAKQLRDKHAAMTARQAHLANVMRAVGGRRDRARRGKVVMLDERFRPGGAGYAGAKRRYEGTAQPEVKRQKQ